MTIKRTTRHYGLLPRRISDCLPSMSCPTSEGKFRSACSRLRKRVMSRSKVIDAPAPLRSAGRTANPEDYTARGKIVTPLEDRIGSEFARTIPERWKKASASPSRKHGCIAMAWSCTFRICPRSGGARGFPGTRDKKSISAPA